MKTYRDDDDLFSLGDVELLALGAAFLLGLLVFTIADCARRAWKWALA
jgi:hypothetical protein